MALESATGPISVTVPAAAALELRVQTSGRISSALALHRSADHTRAWLRIGAARRLLLLSSATGAIEIERGPL